MNYDLPRRALLRAGMLALGAAGGAALTVTGGTTATASTLDPGDVSRLLLGWLSAGLPPRSQVVGRHGARPPQWFGVAGPDVVSSFDSADEVVLTFDACGGPKLCYDVDLIAVLRDQQVPATLFVNRQWALANGRLVTELRDDPLFELANHGDRHVPVSVTGAAAYGIPGTADAGEVYDEIAGGHRLFRRLWGVRSRWFRPGTAHTDDVSARIAVEMGTPVVGFTVNADMGATASAEQVRSALLGFAPGGIALGHMNRPGSGTAAGVAAAVPLLRARGLAFRRLEDVLPG